MIKKIIFTLISLSMTSLFAMSLSQLNSASKEDLMKINGIGEAKATAIIKERAKGKFKSFDDLQRVKGVGPQVASNLKNDVKAGQKVKKVAKSTKKKATNKVTKKLDKQTKKVDKKQLKTKAKSMKKSTKDMKKKIKTPKF
jgi:competence protein ComEA